MNTDNFTQKEYDILLALWRTSGIFNDRLDKDDLTDDESDALQSLEERGIIHWNPAFTRESEEWFGNHLVNQVFPNLRSTGVK